MPAAKRTSTTQSSTAQYGVPGLGKKDASLVIEILQDRLNALNDLALTLKHIHWNVVGPQFTAVHTMLDPQVDSVRLMVDETAERIATLGGAPSGTPGALVAARSWG
jgi:starvation-inducible DNA-binding protein